MKRAVTGVLGIMFVFASVGGALAQAPQGQGQQGRQGGGRGPGAPACTTLACDVQADWQRTRNLVLGVANAMPDDKFSFKPTPAQQSFGERLMHVVQTDLKLLSTLGAKTPAPAINTSATSKADIVAALTQSFDYGAAVLKELNDQQLTERVASMPFMGPMTSRARVVYFSIGHTQDIYGQLVVYLRLNGITPPASARQPV